MQASSHLVTPFFVSMILMTPRTEAVFECKAGFWGSQCGKKCGQCMGGGEFCQVYDGLCMNGCASGFNGKYCRDTCPAGTFGPYCLEKCGHCSGGDTDCDTVTGRCRDACKPGYQMPLCKLPCQHFRWGENCESRCRCPSEDCVCDHLTGKCDLASCGRTDQIRYKKVQSRTECINQYALDDVIAKYNPPNVLEIPWRAILSVIGMLFFFVLSNFLWWWFMVRQPAPPEEPITVDRTQIPEYLAHTQETQRSQAIVLSRLRKKMAAMAKDDKPVAIPKEKPPRKHTIVPEGERHSYKRRQSTVDAMSVHSDSFSGRGGIGGGLHAIEEDEIEGEIPEDIDKRKKSIFATLMRS